ncbi:MAG: bifunctional tetrahydrofolate synthase/dihydrofolate synthase [Steroidobacteraceae bacterium]
MAVGRSLAEWLQRQEAIHGLAIDLGLERVRAVAQRLGLLPPAARCLIVGGTNGKGSTVACLAALLREHGRRVGSFTSPHLLRYNERIRIDAAEAADEQLLAAFEAIDAARGDITLTFFEYNALAALHVFRACAVDFALLEVGLGGRLDAVNIVDAEGVVICSIGLDHMDWLGPDIESIGREKAGVLRAGQQVVLSDPQMTPVVAAEAARVGAHALLAGRDYRYTAAEGSWSFSMDGLVFGSLPPPALPGAVQFANAAASIALLQAIGLPLQEAAVARALRSLRLPGRFQVVPGPVEWILDVSHNEPAARVLAANLAARPCSGRTLVVAGILADKDAAGIAAALAPRTDRWILCGIAAPRGQRAAELAKRSPHWSDALLANDVPAGMALAAQMAVPGDRIVVCGSFLTVAPALEWLGLY